MAAYGALKCVYWGFAVNRILCSVKILSSNISEKMIAEMIIVFFLILLDC